MNKTAKERRLVPFVKRAILKAGTTFTEDLVIALAAEFVARGLTGAEPSFDQLVSSRINSMSAVAKTAASVSVRTRVVGDPVVMANVACTRCTSMRTTVSVYIRTADQKLPYCPNCRIVLLPQTVD